MIISPLKQENKFPVFNFNFGSDLMRFKFILVIALILCAFCVLPVNADIYDTPIHILRTGEPITVTNTDTVYLSVLLPYLTENTVMPSELTINGYELTSVNELYFSRIPPSISSIPLSSFLDYDSNYMPIYALNNPNKDSQMTIHIQWRQSASQTEGFDQVINFVFNDDYLDYLDSAQIIADVDHYSDNTVTYNLQCISDYPNAVLYSSIAGYRDFSLGLIQYNETETITEITAGLDDIIVYAWAYNTYNTDIKLLELELQGRDNFIPPIEPTPQPTDIPIYPDRIQAFIQTYDYQTGNMLTGVNLSVYEVIDNNGNLQIGNNIYSSINAESQTILTVKNITEYFIKNEKTGYFSVKNTVYASLNNETGYLWNPSLVNPLRLYYSRLDASAQYNANFIVQDVNNNGLSGVSVTMDNAVTKVSNSIGGLTFNNISAGTHTFVFVKNGYQTVQQTIDIRLQYAAFYQTMYKDNQIIQPTIQPTAYPTVQPTVQPTITPIDQPSNLAESVKYGLAKMFGVNSLNTINLIFALMIILFPAVVAGVITNQALGFIAGGLIGFVFALGIGLIPIWVFFSMIMLSVIYLVMTHTESGF